MQFPPTILERRLLVFHLRHFRRYSTLFFFLFSPFFLARPSSPFFNCSCCFGCCSNSSISRLFRCCFRRTWNSMSLAMSLSSSCLRWIHIFGQIINLYIESLHLTILWRLCSCSKRSGWFWNGSLRIAAYSFFCASSSFPADFRLSIPMRILNSWDLGPDGREVSKMPRYVFEGQCRSTSWE